MLGLLRELNDLKRLYAYNLGSDSFATWIFRRACDAIPSGQPLDAATWCASVVSAARLGAITSAVLLDIGISDEERIAMQTESIITHESLPVEVCDSLTQACLGSTRVVTERLPSVAEWVERLAAAPRAGATCPGKPRIALEPAEMHSDHCLMVAVYGYILADLFGANREDAWLIGLSHHFHNAYLPDAGFTGEMLLGTHLQQVLATLRTRVISELPSEMGSRVTRLFDEISDVETPLARTFHAADTIDRVLQMEQYERASQFKVKQALEDFNLVHEGTAQTFQHHLLQTLGLFTKLDQ
jgi:5'-deoxynucleotidase YfbR-like HD superfamily hydrolase